MTRRGYSSTAQDNTISASMDATQTTVTMTTALVGFPGTYPYTCVIDSGTANEELVQVTGAPSGLVYPIARAQDGTSPHTHSAGATFKHRASARDFDEPNAHIAASTNVHGLAVGDTVAGTNALALKANDSAVVHNTGNETVAGIKTFSSAPVVPSNSFPESAVTNLTSDLATHTSQISGLTTSLAGKADDTAVVKLTGNQSIGGTKTFTSAPTVPANSFPESAVTNLTSDLSTLTSGLVNRLKLFGVGSAYSGTPSTSIQLLVQTDNAGGTPSSGLLTVTFPNAFPNGIIGVFAWNGDTLAVPGAIVAGVQNVTTSGFKAYWVTPSTNAAYSATSVRTTYVALGW